MGLPRAAAPNGSAGLLHRGAEFVETVAENDSAGVYFVEDRDGAAVEAELDVRLL